jgi:hypothetical protein
MSEIPPFSSHVSPMRPGGQIQIASSELDTLHSAPFLQGEFSHGLTCSSQVLPSHPWAHLQTNCCPFFSQVPLFLQGDSALSQG